MAGAAWLGRNVYEVLRLACWGVFLYSPLFSAAAALRLRRAAPAAARFAAAGSGLMLLVALDAFVIEPHWLQISRVQLATPKLKQHVRIVVLADIQTERVGAYERRALERALAEKPDLILLAGDYVQGSDPARWIALHRELNALLRQVSLRAPLGVYAIGGSVDAPYWPLLFRGTSVRPFVTTRTVAAGPLWLTGLTNADSHNPTLRVPPVQGFHILLGHQPEFARALPDADLLLAGHTHGGQFRLPFFGPLIPGCSLPRRWAAGVTHLPGGRTLIVSRGIGMERGSAPRLRFLCRPEIVVVDLVPAGTREEGTAARPYPAIPEIAASAAQAPERTTAAMPEPG